MFFTVDKSQFEKAITPVSVVAQNKAAESTASGIYIEAKNGQLILYCYDIEKGIKTTVEANIEKEGKIIADLQIVPIIHSLPEGEIVIETDDNFIIRITSGEADFQILGKSAESYPELPEIKGFSSFSISRKQLRAIIAKTMFAVSSDDSKPILKGSLFEISEGILSVCAIDGFRISVRTEKSTADNPDLNVSFIIPGKAQQNLLRIIDDSEEEVICELANKHILFQVDNLYILIRLLEGEFPQYKKYIPTYEVSAVVEKNSLIASLERVALINDKLKSSAKLNFINDQLKISCETEKGKINDLLPIYMEGNPIEVNFNQNYLIEALRACDDEKVVMRISAGGKGLVIVAREEDEKEESFYLQLVMPVRSR